MKEAHLPGVSVALYMFIAILTSFKLEQVGWGLAGAVGLVFGPIPPPLISSIEGVTFLFMLLACLSPLLFILNMLIV